MKLISTSIHIRIAGAVFGVMVGISTVCNAGETSAPAQVVVRFADLSISNPQAAASLYQRIDRAAGDVCWRMYMQSQASTEAYRHNEHACRQRLIADAVTRVNEPALAAVFKARYGVAPPLQLASASAR